MLCLKIYMTATLLTRKRTPGVSDDCCLCWISDLQAFWVIPPFTISLQDRVAF